MTGEVLEIDPEKLAAAMALEAQAAHAQSELKELWVMQNELCQTMASKHDPLNGVDLSEPVLVALAQLDRIMRQFTLSLSRVVIVPAAPAE